MTLNPEQLENVIDFYCNRVVDEMDTKSMEQMLYDLLLDSFANSSENDMEELICSVYGKEYWDKLVFEAVCEE
jgi:hypothetical protein